MQQSELPALKRTLPKPIAWFLTLLFYAFIVPVNWLLTRVFKRPGFVLMSTRAQAKMQARVEKAFDQYTPTEHDVFVNTFSKSGTNWMLQMTHQIAFLGEGEFNNIHDVVTWPDFYEQMKGKFTIGLDDTLVLKASPTQLRIIKSHLAAQHIPYNDQARYITVIRDPKDVFVSSYHFIKGLYGPIMPTVEHWLDAFLSDNFPISFGATWAQHTASYWALKDKPNVLILSFREMKKDLTGTVKQVARFMDVDLSAAQLATLINKSSFDYMKGVDDKFFPIQRNALPWMQAEMMRKGKEGNSKEMISPEQQRRIDAFFIAQLKALGSDFPYTDYCRLAE